MGKTVAVINQKGGAGKTATTISIAHALAEIYKSPTLLADMDPSSNASKPFCTKYEFTIKDVLNDKNFDPNDAIYKAVIKGKECQNLYIMPSNISLAMIQNLLSGRPHKEKILLRQLEKIKDKFDFIFIDCPPLLTEFSTISTYAADFILIPTTYEADALDGISDLFKIISEVKEEQHYDYRILKNARDNRCTDAIAAIDAQLEPFNHKLFNTVISQDAHISNAKFEQKTVFTFAPNSQGAKDYLALSQELKELLNAKNTQR